MTLAPNRPRLAISGLDSIIAAIRAGGGRMSSTRRVVLSALFAAEGPVSADYIADGLGGRMVRSEVSSVYRALERLEELGAVRHVHVAHGPGLYALEGDTPLEYLVCERCDRVDTVDAALLDRVRAEIHETFGYEARFSHFPIVALCRACARSEAESREVRGATGEVTPRGTTTHHEHNSVAHAHEHTHGDYVHAHEHEHQRGFGEGHEHGH